MKTTLLKSLFSRLGGYVACLLLGIAMLPQTARASYATSVLSNNPAAFWQLAETGNASTGTLPANDSSGNGHTGIYGIDSYDALNGILSPQPPTYPGFASGQGALQPTTTDPNSPVFVPLLNLNTNAVTIAMWINVSSIPQNAGLLMNRNTAGDAAGLDFGNTVNTNTGVYELGYIWNTNNANTYNFNSSLYPLSGVWTFVALVVQSNSATIYMFYIDPVSGQPVLQSAVNNIAHTPESFASGYTLIGDDVVNSSAGDPTRVFGGQISDVSVFTSALSQQQVQALFAVGIGVSGFPPSITGQPQSQVVLAGAKTQFSVSGINGTLPVSYQWQLNNTNVNLLADNANFTGANSNILTVLSATTNDLGTYHLVLTNIVGLTVSSNATLTIQTPALVGEWFGTNSASTNFLDVSGYSLAPNHDAYVLGASNYMFTNDVPAGQTGQSLFLFSTNTGIAISNSSTMDSNYDTTFDNAIGNSITVACWAKGWPTAWSPFVSKYGETTPNPSGGWQLREDGNNNVSPCWTIRGAGGTTNGLAQGTQVFSNPEDLAATSYTLGVDGVWHYYVGTYDASTGLRKLYVDGNLGAVETNTSPYLLAPLEHLCIGARATNGVGADPATFFKGEIFDVRIYNFAIPLSTVQQLYGQIPAAVATQPKSVTAFTNTTVQFTTIASGTPPLVYQWQLNGTNINLLADSANFTGVNSNILTILNTSTNDVGSYHLALSNNYAMTVSSNATLTIVPKLLVGRWFGGTNTDLKDISGYQPPGTHDGFAIGAGVYAFTNDVPAGRTGQFSIALSTTNAIAISNSSTNDANYTNTFDDTISGAMSVAFWARGWPGGWNPFVSKNGDSGSPNAGWDVRNDGNNNISPCFTMRSPGGTVTLGTAVYGSSDDLAATSLTYGNDNQWHHYAATYSTSTHIRYLWVDGKIAATATGVGNYNLARYAHVVLGGIDHSPGNTFTGYFTGKLYDVRIYNYDLSSNEIAILSALPDPLILSQPPAAVTGFVGLNIQISAKGSGSAPLNYQWQLNNVNLVDGTLGGATFTGSTSNVLTIANLTTNVQGTYHLILSSPNGMTISSNAVLTVLPTATAPAAHLVGEWLSGATNLVDTSGYSPAGTHDGYGTLNNGTVSSFYSFTNDVPPGKVGNSLVLSAGNTCIAISNSSTLDANYTNTYDDPLTNAMTVMVWAKGVPAGWAPFAAKNGDSGSPNAGWDLRVNNSSHPTWTIRGTLDNDDMQSPTATEGTQWHEYAGTYNSVTGIRSLYVDGQLAAQQTGETNGFNLAAYAHVAIGGIDHVPGNTFTGFFTGRLYDMRIYNIDLTAAQINGTLVSTNPSVPVFSGPPVLSGGNLVLTWSSGSLLQATNLTGPWTPTGATSPYTNNVSTAPQKFYRLSNP